MPTRFPLRPRPLTTRCSPVLSSLRRPPGQLEHQHCRLSRCRPRDAPAPPHTYPARDAAPCGPRLGLASRDCPHALTVGHPTPPLRSFAHLRQRVGGVERAAHVPTSRDELGLAEPLERGLFRAPDHAVVDARGLLDGGGVLGIDDEGERDVHVPLVQSANDDVGEAGEGGVDGVSSEHAAEDAVGGEGGHAADVPLGRAEADGHSGVDGVEVLIRVLLEELPDVELAHTPLALQAALALGLQSRKAALRQMKLARALVHGASDGATVLAALGRVQLGLPALHGLLPGAVLHHDDGIALAVHHLVDVLEHHARVEAHALDEAHIRVARRHDRVEANLAAAELDDADAALHAARRVHHLLDGLHRALHDGVEPDALVDEGHVVLDALGQAHDAQLQLARHGALLDRVRAAAGVDVAQHVELVHAAALDAVEHLLHVALVGGESQDGAPLLVHALHPFRRELQPVLGLLVREAAPAVSHSPNTPNVVCKVERGANLADYDVNARIQSAASDDGGIDLGRAEKRLLPRARANPFSVNQAFAFSTE
mmetsp:Transcript_18922/g.52053  ORF Transcript_18922/g.52053 Transcript_18922/m.52053 type:complete len:542 (-) Transcript_18922:345-1970(-)